MLKDVIEQRGLSVYKVSKETGISYSTLNDIVIEKTDIKNISANMLYRLSKYFEMSMEALYEDSESKNSIIYLYNEGRNIILEFGKNRIQYLGPKNLLSFHRINKIDSNVLYVDCYFEDTDGLIYCEEDYIDLLDVCVDYPAILDKEYLVKLENPSESTKENIINRSMLVSDNIAILYYVDKNIPDLCIQAISLARTNACAVVRLKDLSVVSSNMSEALLKRALDAVRRNIEEINEEVEEVSQYA